MALVGSTTPEDGCVCGLACLATNGCPDLKAVSGCLARAGLRTGEARYMTAAAFLADESARDLHRDQAARIRRRRNELICELANRYFPNEKPWRQANRLFLRFRDFRIRWVHEQHRFECPTDIRKTIDGAIWELWSEVGDDTREFPKCIKGLADYQLTP